MKRKAPSIERETVIQKVRTYIHYQEYVIKIPMAAGRLGNHAERKRLKKYLLQTNFPNGALIHIFGTRNNSNFTWPVPKNKLG